MPAAYRHASDRPSTAADFGAAAGILLTLAAMGLACATWGGAAPDGGAGVTALTALAGTVMCLTHRGWPWSRGVTAAGLVFFLYLVLTVIPLPRGIVEQIAPLSASSQASGERVAVAFGEPPGGGWTLAAVPSAALGHLAELAAVAVWSTGAALLFRRRRALAVPLAAAVFGAAIVYTALAVWALWANAAGRIGPHFNPNHFAGFCELALGCGVALAGWSLSGRMPAALFRPSVIAAGALVLLVGVLMARSRSGAAAFAAQVAALGAVAIRRRITRAQAAGLAVGAAAVIAFLALAAPVELLTDKIARGEGDITRARLAEDSLRAWGQSPVFGTGLGGHLVAFAPVQDPAWAYVEFNHAHNEYLQWLVEYGLLGGALLAWVLGSIAAQILRGPRPRSGAWVRAGAGVGILGLMLHGLTDFNWRIPLNLLGTWLLVAVLVAGAPPCAGRQEHRS